MNISLARRAHRFAIAAPVAALVWACTTAEQPTAGATPAGRQCFLASRVSGFHAIDDDTVRVFVGPSRVYELEISPTCPNIDWSTTVGIRATGGSSWVCRGLDAELFVRSGIGLNRCPVLGVRPLSREEAEAARRAR